MNMMALDLVKVELTHMTFEFHFSGEIYYTEYAYRNCRKVDGRYTGSLRKLPNGSRWRTFNFPEDRAETIHLVMGRYGVVEGGIWSVSLTTEEAKRKIIESVRDFLRDEAKRLISVSVHM
jgi:hypothetical protein